MKKVTTLLLLLWTVMGFTGLKAQRTHSISGGIGTIYYYGDLTDRFKSALLKPSVALHYQNYIQDRLSFRFGLSYGEIGASDRLALDEERQNRNLHFRSPLFEVSGIVVYEIFKDKHFGNSWLTKPFLTPYIFTGITLFRFNPQARYSSTWVDLQPLGTEGQLLPGSGEGPYSLTQVSIPVGVGLSLRLTRYAGVNVELGYRITRTDYLDDVSTKYPDLEELRGFNPAAADLSMRSEDPQYIQRYGDIRGNPGAKDGYFLFNLSIVYYLSQFASRD